MSYIHTYHAQVHSTHTLSLLEKGPPRGLWGRCQAPVAGESTQQSIHLPPVTFTDEIRVPTLVQTTYFFSEAIVFCRWPVTLREQQQVADPRDEHCLQSYVVLRGLQCRSIQLAVSFKMGYLPHLSKKLLLQIL